MEGARKHILERFQEHLSRSFEIYCKRHGLNQSEDRLITFLIDQDLIPGGHAQKYAVIKEYEQLLQEQAYQKTQMVSLLAHRFNISERTVWAILKPLSQPKKSKQANEI